MDNQSKGIKSLRKKAFVTGAGGFIGSQLVESLLTKGWNVKALIKYNSCSSWGWLERLRENQSENLEVLLGDVTDSNLIKQAVSDCDVVFHLAALIGIPYSYVAPASYIQTNVVGTLNLIQASIECGIERFIHTSTSEVYGTAIYTPIDENHPLQAQSPYSASKISADKLVESFYCSFDFPAVIVRPFNTYGPRQSSRAVIPTIISQALTSNEIHLGSLDPVRDLTFVTDTAEGFIAAAEADSSVHGNVINLGTGNSVSIGDLVRIIAEILGNDFDVIEDKNRVRPEKSEVMTLISKNKKAKDLLNWEPKLSINDGLSHTIDWIRDNLSTYKNNEYTV